MIVHIITCLAYFPILFYCFLPPFTTMDNYARITVIKRRFVFVLLYARLCCLLPTIMYAFQFTAHSRAHPTSRYSRMEHSLSQLFRPTLQPVIFHLVHFYARFRYGILWHCAIYMVQTHGAAHEIEPQLSSSEYRYCIVSDLQRDI